jgi:hypothetical protein
MLKLDLHTHSIASSDGSISEFQYRQALGSGLLDCIAITDHNQIDFALGMKNHLGEKIIVGEEIMTTRGEIIGLFLSKSVPAGLTPQQTAEKIKEQNGIVYIPHPFETLRKGLTMRILDEMKELIDIVEVFNGRAFLQNRGQQATVWTKINHLSRAASSDAHGIRGLGRTYTSIQDMPTRQNILALLKKAPLMVRRPSARALLYPKYNRLLKKLRR